MQNKPLLSICIPTYNREKYLKECLESIVYQKWFNQEDIEIVISDNASTDNTKELVQEYQERFNNIKYYRNKENVWSANNVICSVEKSIWEYVWIFGDDDIVVNFWFKSIIDTLFLNKNIWWLFVNYFTFSEKTKLVLKSSIIHDMNKWCELKITNDEIIILDWNLIFNYINQVPTFLSSLIMKKSFFQKNDLNLFFDNLYPHTWICSLNTINQKIWLITKPLIRWLIPEKGWWHKNGVILFEAALDYLYMNHIVSQDPRCPFLMISLKKYKRDYLRNFPKNIILSKVLWFKIQEKYLQKLKQIYWNGLIYYMYIIPIIYLPFWNFIKKIIPSRYL